jgi:F-type H+-transporting ATPase subunit gamma
MKAMELVAASKMRKAIGLVTGGRPYEEAISHLVQQLLQAPGVDLSDPFLRSFVRQDKRSTRLCVVVFASDRGLCGGFNTQVSRATLEFLRSHPQDQLTVITVGSRVERAIRAAGYTIAAAFPAVSQNPSFEQLHPLFKHIRNLFLSGEADRVCITYTHFQSALSQQTRVTQLLPIEVKPAVGKASDDLVEPSVGRVFRHLLPRLIDAHMYQTVLESAASEHSARMLAMRSASDAAKDMSDDLALSLNQARQAAITREISEISAGKAALTA